MSMVTEYEPLKYMIYSSETGFHKTKILYNSISAFRPFYEKG